MTPAAANSRFLGLPPELRVMVYKIIAYSSNTDTMDAENLRLVCRQIKEEFDHDFIEETAHQVNELTQRLSRSSTLTANYENLTTAAEINARGSRFKLTHTPNSFKDCQHLTFTVNPLLDLNENSEEDKDRVFNFLLGLPSVVRAVTVNVEKPTCNEARSLVQFIKHMYRAMLSKYLNCELKIRKAAQSDWSSSPTQKAQDARVSGIVRLRLNWPMGYSLKAITPPKCLVKSNILYGPIEVDKRHIYNHLGGLSGMVYSIEHLASM